MNIQPISSKEANEINIESEQNIEKLRSLAFHYQNQAVEAHKELRKLRPAITDEQAKKFAGK